MWVLPNGLEDLVFRCDTESEASNLLSEAFNKRRFATCLARHATNRAFLISHHASTPSIFRLTRGKMHDGGFVKRHSYFRYVDDEMITFTAKVYTSTQDVHMLPNPRRFPELFQTYMNGKLGNEPTCWLTPKTLRDDPDRDRTLHA